MDLFLKFENEEQAISVLYETIPAVKNEKDEVIRQVELRPLFKNIDTIGYISKPTGETETVELHGEKVEQPVMEQIEGWHVNVRLTGEDSSQLTPFIVQPKAPQRVWA